MDRTVNIVHFYPRSPYGERQFRELLHPSCTAISIHALLTESDKPKALKSRLCVISIHALLTESDDDFEPSSTRKLTFLSTLSLRRATSRINGRIRRPRHFYPRSPYGERLETHQSQVESRQFLSTLSLRRATRKTEVPGAI